MPLTSFQRQVARVLAANRNPDSHVAGGAAINRAEGTLRYSEDFDIFHDAAASVAECARIDEASLLAAGYAVHWTACSVGFYRAEVTQGTDHLRLDWSADSAFRFFPAQEDADFGYCLHRADLATNKVLALAGRNEIRDFLDVLQLDQDYLSLGATVWAACGKDQGYTPELLLQLANRHSRHQDVDLRSERLARPVELKELKQQWLTARERAEALIGRLPPEELGCLYLDETGEPVTPDPGRPEFAGLRRHFGSVRGAWPRFA